MTSAIGKILLEKSEKMGRSGVEHADRAVVDPAQELVEPAQVGQRYVHLGRAGWRRGVGELGRLAASIAARAFVRRITASAVSSCSRTQVSMAVLRRVKGCSVSSCRTRAYCRAPAEGPC